MRTIKFRYWSEDTKKMIDGKEAFGILNETIQHNLIVANIMQYTGLSDKNGKEVFEGDVLVIEQDEGIDDFPNWVTHKAEVIFDRGCFLGIFDMPLGDFCEGFEPVIAGNVYENPELLEEVK